MGRKLAMTVAMPILMVGALLTSRYAAVRPEPAPASVIVPDGALDASVGPTASTDTDDSAPGIVDLFGNEVSEAVTEYGVDATGSEYELHSPQTELPRLGSPKS